MNEGQHILVTKYGEVEDWCMTEAQLERFQREKGYENMGKFQIFEGKEAIEKLVSIIHDKHEDKEFDHNFRMAESALTEMLTELYGLEFS